MNEESTRLILEGVPNQQRANELMEKLFTLTRPSAVYSEPVSSGEYTVITACEVTAGIGFGYGGGGGEGPTPAENEAQVGGGTGFGGGGGGGGGTAARPVAAVIIGPDGVRVEPIVDPTKIALAFFTMLGSIFLTARKMRRFKRTKELT
jgi:uncharacterized spore protein YtfJ